MITIIIPMYNAKLYIEKCVESIIQQTYNNIEIIIVDDGSTDGSKTLCDELVQKDSRIHVIHKPNGGVSSARNRGLEVAKGENVMFVDADDYLKPDLCDKLLAKIEEADLVIGGYEQVTKAGSIMCCIQDSVIDLRENLDEYFEEVFEKNAFNSPFAKLYKKEILGKQKFQEDIALGEDFLFNLEYMRKCHKVAVVNTASYIYNCLNENSATKKFRERDFSSIVLHYNAMRKFLQEVSRKTIDNNVVERRLCLNGINLVQLLFYSDASWKDKKEKIKELLGYQEYQAVCGLNFNFPLKYKIPQILLNNKKILGIRIFFFVKKFVGKILR